MFAKPHNCAGCALEVLGTGFSQPEGACSNGVLMVGEALGSNEASEGLPFRPYAEAGSVLERAIKYNGMSREQFGLYNIIACQPPSNELSGQPYEIPAINHCVPNYLAGVINYYKPKVILALGAIPMRVLTGLTGEKYSMDLLRGFALKPEGQFKEILKDLVIVPTYHPAYINRGNHALSLVLERDMQKAVRLASLSSDELASHLSYKPDYKRYLNEFQLKELYNWLKLNPSHPVSYDFETIFEKGAVSRKKPITQINLSLAPGSALTADYSDQNQGIIRDILACTPNPKFGHNSYHFDEYVAEYNGFEIRGERHDDTMWAFHWVYSDLPGSKGGQKTSNAKDNPDEDGALAPLQFCASFYDYPHPWKHLASIDPHEYGGNDSDSCYWVRNGMFADMVKFGPTVWHGYNIFIVELRRELKRMEARGICADVNKLRELSADLAKSIRTHVDNLQTFVPNDLKTVSPVSKVPTPVKELFESKGVPLPNVGPYPLVLDETQTELLSNVQTFEARNKDGNLTSLGYSVRRFEVLAKKCICLTKSHTGEASVSCERCQGSGHVRFSTKSVVCNCKKSPKGSCGECVGLGWGKPDTSKKCVHDWKYDKEGYFVCALCEKQKKGKACPCVKTIDPECIICAGSGRTKVYDNRDCVCRLREVPAKDCQYCYGTGLFTGSIHKWAKIKPFNPASPKQMLSYTQLRGYRIPLNSKRKIAMDKETILKLAKITKDPVYSVTKVVRELSKIKSSYADAWDRESQIPEGALVEPINYADFEQSKLAYHAACRDANLRTVHTTFSYRPATTQLSSIEPNVQVTPNVSKYGELAVRFREAIIAPEGYVIIEFDYRSFHVLMLGYCAGDPDYIRLARLDPHSFLAAQLLQLPGCDKCLSLPDDELKAYLSYVKKHHEPTRNGRAKPAILGYGFGMGASRLYDNNPEAFENFEQAKAVIDMLNACFPVTARFRLTKPEQAHRQRYLINPYGAMRWFMNVKTFDHAKQSYKHGKDWEKAIAFEPASIAFSIIKLAKLELARMGLTNKWNLVNNIHDAMVFICPIKFAEECLHYGRQVMEQPRYEVLDPHGQPIWCEVEAKLGKTWAKTNEFKYRMNADIQEYVQ